MLVRLGLTNVFNLCIAFPRVGIRMYFRPAHPPPSLLSSLCTQHPETFFFGKIGHGRFPFFGHVLPVILYLSCALLYMNLILMSTKHLKSYKTSVTGLNKTNPWHIAPPPGLTLTWKLRPDRVNDTYPPQLFFLHHSASTPRPALNRMFTNHGSFFWMYFCFIYNLCTSVLLNQPPVREGS